MHAGEPCHMAHFTVKSGGQSEYAVPVINGHADLQKARKCFRCRSYHGEIGRGPGTSFWICQNIRFVPGWEKAEKDSEEYKDGRIWLIARKLHDGVGPCSHREIGGKERGWRALDGADQQAKGRECCAAR